MIGIYNILPEFVVMTNTVKKTDEINNNVTINGVIKNVVKKKEDTNVNITENVVEENLSKEIYLNGQMIQNN